jgi:hypothetical protein
MSKPVRSRRIVALFAAYMVALQALLLPLSVAVGGPLGLSHCAATASVEGSPSPASHQTGLPCAAGCGMQCCSQALTGPPPIAIAVADMRASVMTPVPSIEPVIRPADRRPQIPRAPPAA